MEPQVTRTPSARVLSGRPALRAWKASSARRVARKRHDAVRIVIADDQALFRDGLRGLLESEKDLRVVGEAATGDEAFKLASEATPDILLVSLTLAGRSGLEVVEGISTACLPVRAVVLAGVIDRIQMLELLRLGVRGIVQKETGTQLLLDGIRAVMAGKYWLKRQSAAGLAEALRQVLSTSGGNGSGVGSQNSFGLTSRELEIVGAIVSGNTNKEIAQKFSLGERTVKHHLTNIFNKLGVGTRLELALFAVHQRLVKG
jgi:two-component system nitrate/nitrite response regulator NarL